MSELSKGDVVEIENETFVIRRVDRYNNRIIFESGYSIHKAALFVGSVTVTS